MKKGRFTLPADNSLGEKTKEIAKKWGADAVRDCDGTALPDNPKQYGKVYNTYFIVRGDNEWARLHPEEAQRIFLLTERILATGESVQIEIMEHFLKDEFDPDVSYLDRWEVYDRTVGQLHSDWSYDKKTGVVTDATVPMTVEHLFTMCGGMNYDIASQPIKDAIAAGKTSTLDIVKAMAQMPLNFEPGTHYQYSLCHDVLAAVVEVVSEMKFSDFLQKYMFDPLGLKDIGFRPTEEQLPRFCDQFRYKNGTNEAIPRGPISNSYMITPEYDSGGAGLFSTVDDYMRIITVIANGGKTEDGYSLLRPETIDLLTVNRLCDDALNDFAVSRLYGYGWGLCGRVHRDPIVSCSKAPVGEFGWDGAAGSFSMVDPINKVALYFGFNLFSLVYGYNFLHPYIRNMVYEALEAN